MLDKGGNVGAQPGRPHLAAHQVNGVIRKIQSFELSLNPLRCHPNQNHHATPSDQLDALLDCCTTSRSHKNVIRTSSSGQAVDNIRRVFRHWIDHMGGTEMRHHFELVAGQVQCDIKFGIRQRSALHTIDPHATHTNRHHACPCRHGRHILHRPDPCNYAAGKQGRTVHRQIRRDFDDLGGVNNDFIGKCASPQTMADGDTLLIGDRRGFVQWKTSLAQAFLALPAKKAITARAE